MAAPLLDYLRSLTPVLMVKTNDEVRLVEELHGKFLKAAEAAREREGKDVSPPYELQVWNPSFGTRAAGGYLDEMNTLASTVDDAASRNPLQMLQTVYETRQGNKGADLFYLMLDADVYLNDAQVQRRILNIACSSGRNTSMRRMLILVSPTGKLPPKLEPYVSVLDYGNPSDPHLKSYLTSLESHFQAYMPDYTLPAGRDAEEEVGEDFVKACRGLTLHQVREIVTRLTISSPDYKVTLDSMVQERRAIIEKSDLLELVDPMLTFDDVAGLDALKGRLMEVREAWTPEGRAWGVPNSRGLLMIGVPGCGKSLMAKALAKEMGVSFVRFDPSALFSARVGDSEANMRRALQDIEAVAPAVVFVDEIEKGLAGSQSSSFSDSGTTARVIGTFLSWFQDHAEDIFVIATANGITSLPPELVSRFEEKYFVGLPDVEARKICFDIQLSKYWRDGMGKKDAVDTNLLAASSSNLTGREIEQVVCDGMRKAYMTEEKVLTTEILEEVVRTKPPLIQTMEEEIRTILGWVGYDPVRREGVRAKYASSARIVELEGDFVPAENRDRMASLLAGTDLNQVN